LNIPPYLIAEMVCLLIGIWRYKNLPAGPFRMLVWFLACIVSVEWYGLVAGRWFGGAIGMVFNFSVPLEYMFFVWFITRHITSPIGRRFGHFYLLAFLGFMLLNNLFSKETGFHGIYMKIGILGVLFFCCFYFAELLRKEEVVNPLLSPVFWICCGLFIFNIGEFVYGFGIAKLANDPKAWVAIFKALNSNLNVLLYSCISVAMIMVSWRK
jgi:hypothetical protein